MNLVDRSEPAFFKTPFTQRVLRHIAVSYSFPSPSVLLVHVRGTLVLVVASAGLLAMLLAILPVTKVRTTGEGTGALWFSRHTIHLPSLYKKSSRGNPREPFLFSFPIIMIP
jgi:hypothetical protein